MQGAGATDAIEARLRGALAHAHENCLDETIRIWSRVVDWFVDHAPALKAHL